MNQLPLKLDLTGQHCFLNGIAELMGVGKGTMLPCLLKRPCLGVEDTAESLDEQGAIHVVDVLDTESTAGQSLDDVVAPLPAHMEEEQAGDRWR